jgi:glycosyltransferase involved in cell wall biosynthesis
MKVLIVNNAVPFTWGGAEELALNLAREINARKGMEAEVMRVPFAWQPKERLVSEILLNRSLNIHIADRVIALKFPAYYVNHHAKTIWLLHQFRQAYDLLDNGQSFLSRGEDPDILHAIREADNACFDGAKKVFANSPVTKARLKLYNERNCEVLYPPLNDARLFGPGEYGDYIFAGGRVDPGKRQHLLAEAAFKAGEACKLVIAGPATDEAYAAKLHAFVEENNLAHRIRLQIRMHSREEIAALARNALACAYIPFDEDSLGYVTMEGASAARALITTTDSGGLLELVKDGETGLVASPDVPSLAKAFSRVSSDHALAKTLGKAARALWDAKDITWEATIRRLLS